MEKPKSTVVYELNIGFYDNVIDTSGTDILFSSYDEALKAAKFVIKQLQESGYSISMDGIVDDICINKRVIFLDENFFEEESDKRIFNDEIDKDYLHRLNRCMYRLERS